MQRVNGSKKLQDVVLCLLTVQVKTTTTIVQVKTSRYGLNYLLVRGILLWNTLKDEIKRDVT